MQRSRFLLGIISAFRCEDCGHDTVMDTNGKMWDLDDTDYTDNGSWITGLHEPGINEVTERLS